MLRVDLPELMNGKTAPSNVRWDEDTQICLADKIVEYMKNRPFDSFTKLLNRAQNELLPPEEHRNINGKCMVPVISKRIHERMREIFKKAAERDELESQFEAQAPPPTRSELLASVTDEELRSELADRFMGLYAPAEILEMFGSKQILELIDTPELIGYCVTRYLVHQDSQKQPVNVQVVQQGTQQTNRLNGHANGHARVSVAPEKPQIAIIGPTGRHADLLRRRMNGAVDLTFIDGMTDQMPMIPTSVPHAVIWTNHCRKPVLDKLKAKYGKVEAFTGGVANLEIRLRELI